MRSLLCDELWDMGYRLVEASDGDEAFRYVMAHHVDLILTDLRMPAGGLDYLARLRQAAPAVPIILMTAFGDAEIRAEALRLGVAAYFDKPVRIGDLKRSIKQILGNQTAEEPIS